MDSQPFTVPQLLDLPSRYERNYRGRILNVHVQNIVLRGSLNMDLNLSALVQRHRDLVPQYDRQKFSSLITRNGMLTILLFQQRSFLCVGGKDITDIFSSLINLISEIRHRSYPRLTIEGTNVMNVVVNIATPMRIDVERLSADNPFTCTLIVFSFPGVIYIPNRNGQKTTALIFKSGQINIVGVQTDRDLDEFVGHLLTFISDYQLPVGTTPSTETTPPPPLDHLYLDLSRRDDSLRRFLVPDASSALSDWAQQ